ncbi:MAG: T9SS type A sorting domain-containing protein [Flavobacteriaceae bacterium]
MKTKLLSTLLTILSYISYSQQANDTCANAETLTITTTEQQVNLDLTGVSYTSQNGCDATDIDNYTNYWYEFTMPTNSNLYINVTINNNAELYDVCGGAQLYCFNKNKLLTDLVGGQTYKLRVFRSQSQGNTRPYFYINSYDKIANDDCSNADVLPTLTSSNTEIQFQLAGASKNLEETCSGVIEDDILDAWWQLTMPITGNLFIDTPGGNGIAVYDACNGNEMFCNASESSLDAFKLIDNLVQGNTYLIRFFNTEQTLFENPFQIMNLRVYERATNDECANAEVLPTITTTSQMVAFNTFGSLINFEESCVGLSQDDFVDVWFEFTMPNNTYLIFESYPFNFFSIYDSCQGNEVDCFGGYEEVSGLTPNQSYILRVFQRQTEMFHPNQFFNIYGSDTLSNDAFLFQDTSMQMISGNMLKIKNLNESASLDLYNLLGQRVKHINKIWPESEQILQFEHLQKGIYIAFLNTTKGTKSLKLIVN